MSASHPQPARRYLGLLLALLIGAGCSDEIEPVRPDLAPLSPIAIVLNGRGENLSVLDLEDGGLTANATAVGAVPNHLTLTDDGHTLLVTSSGSNSIDVVDLDDFELIRSIDLGRGNNPFESALLGERTLYVTEWLTHRVARVDWQSGRIEARIPVGTSPEGIAVHGDRAYVACSRWDEDPTFTTRGEVSVVEGDSVVATITVGRNPQTVVVVENEVHVICTGRYGAFEGQIMIIDPAALAVVDSVSIGGSPAYAVQDGEAVYVSGFYGGLLKYDWRRREVLRGIDDPVLPILGLYDLDIDRDTGRLYVTVFPDDLLLAVEADTLAAQWVVGHGPQRVLVRRGAGSGS